MQLTAAIVAAALVAGASSAPVKSSGSITVPLTRRRFMGATTGPDGLFSQQALDREIAYLRAKYNRTLHSFKRNTGAAHPFDRRAEHSKRGTGTISLQDVNNNELWIGPMSFGGQQIQFDFDTGSADTLVNSGVYDPSQSSTSQDTGTTFQDSYGDGTSASGEVYTDNLDAGGLQASGATIGLAQQQFVQSPDQGIAGMGYPSLAAFQQQTPFFDSLINAGVLDYPGFTFQLSEGSSSLTLGSLNQGNGCTPVTQQAYWSVDATVNGQNSNGIIDSGTTLIVAPTDQAEQLFNSLGLQYSTSNGQTTANYDCNSPPSITYSYSGVQVPLGQFVNAGANGDGTCVLSVVGADVGSSGVIMGDPVFQAAGAIGFDRQNNQVCFS